MPDEAAAKSILESAHAAWSKGNIEGVLNCYVDDLTFWCNTGGPDGAPLTIEGKQAFRAFLLRMQSAEGHSVVEFFRFWDGVGRAQIRGVIRHKLTGHKLAGSFRQVVYYRDNKIARLEEFHDAARMAAFWQLVAGEAIDDDSAE
jgi:ketosteroid isomerase-like protein